MTSDRALATAILYTLPLHQQYKSMRTIDSLCKNTIDGIFKLYTPTWRTLFLFKIGVAMDVNFNKQALKQIPLN
jgi:hypothetical protein